MSVISNALLLGGGDTAFTTDRSVRLRSSASAYFERTVSVAGNRRTWTWSGWVKRGTLGVSQRLFNAYSTNENNTTEVGFDATNNIIFSNVISGTQGNGFYGQTSAVFRDPSAWYHIVFSVDTTQSTAAAALKVYVNGVQQTLGTSSYGGGANQNTWINAALPHRIGQTAPPNNAFFDGYLTEINFVDGQALTPSAFGEYDAVRNTQWKPKAYSGSWGTNGFYLKFANPASIGLDSSGNGNNWTATGIQTSNSALTTYDSMLDVPTLTSETASNFCVLNPVSTNVSGIVPQQGNLYLGSSATYNYSIVGTIGVSSGKWYWECRTDSGFSMVGITSLSSLPLQMAPHQSGSLAKIIYAAAAQKYDNGTSSAYGATWTSADLIGIALDMDAGTLTFYKNGTSLGVAFSGLTGIYYPVFGGPNSYNHGWINFGQRPFEQTVPTNFKRLNTYNLLDGAVTSSDDYHKVYTYTGNGGGQQVGEIQKPLSLYNLDRSLRFKGTNSYFDKVFASGGANTKGTFSFWVKRGKLAVQQELIRFGTTGTLFSGLLFNASDQLAFLRLNSTYQVNLVTTRVFRDPNAWYHIVVAWDSTLGPSSNSVKIYINGIQETVFTSSTYPSASLDMYFFTAGTHNIGRYPVGGNYFGGYMAEFHAVDGTQLTPDSFGQFDGNYYWTPKDYTGGYGTNGWHLDFEDFSSMSATGIGKDVSGLGNNFTPYSFNVTVPANTNADWDSMVDVPTLTSADVANFATLSPVDKYSAITVANGNLYTDGAGSAGTALSKGANSTLSVTSGKWYWEVTQNVGSGAYECRVGIWTDSAASNNIESSSTGRYFYRNAGSNLTRIYNGTSFIDYSSYYGTFTDGDVLMFALDVDSGKMWLGKNGTWFNNAGGAKSPASGTNADWTSLPVGSIFAHAANYQTTSQNSTMNFGQRPFRYTPPTGFKSINSFNIAEVTGDLESPDFVWIKSRSAGTDHALFNSVRGVGKYLRSSVAGTEVTDVNSLIQFNKNGFLLGNATIVNTLAATYVAAAWKLNSTTVTNTLGTITSQVRGSGIAGMSVVKYVGNGTGVLASVGHGLGQTPELVIVKNTGAATNWPVYCSKLASAANFLLLNSTALQGSDSNYWGSTPPDAAQFYIFGTTGSYTNISGNTYEAICVRSISGFSKITSYAANGSSTDGPFVECGFAPRWIMIKRATGTSGTGGWIMYDTSRSTYNTMSEYLFAEGAAGGNTLAAIDVTANGFKIKTNNVHLNQTANDIYIVIAFAEHPFKYSLAR